MCVFSVCLVPHKGSLWDKWHLPMSWALSAGFVHLDTRQAKVSDASPSLLHVGSWLTAHFEKA